MKTGAMNRNFGVVGGLSLLGIDVGAGINTDDATATVAEILAGKTAYVRGSKVTGTMPNRATFGVSGDPTDNGPNGRHAALDLWKPLSGKYVYLKVPNGFYPGTDEWVWWNDPNFIAANIRQGVSIFGLEGTLIEGKRTASGSGTVAENGYVSVSGIGFRPGFIILEGVGTNAYRYRKIYYNLTQETAWNLIAIGLLTGSPPSITYDTSNITPWNITDGGFSVYFTSICANRSFTWRAVEV